MDTPFWHWLISIWLLAMGGSIGSFMNVVIYRLPRRLSIVHPGSHCPTCHHSIRWYDNIPVLSWFLLGGRCRDCQSHFSLRYAAVEALMAVLFLTLGHLEALREEVHLLGNYQSWGICIFRLTLVCSLICAALIQWDRGKMPFQLLAFVWLTGMVAPAFFPKLHPNVNYPATSSFTSHSASIASWEYSLLGVLSGLFLTGIVYGMGSKKQHRIDHWDVGFAGAIGSFLGWNAMVCIIPLATLLSILCERYSGRRLWIGCMTDMTLLWIFTWRYIEHHLPLLGPIASWPTFLAVTLCIVLLCLLRRTFPNMLRQHRT